MTHANETNVAAPITVERLKNEVIEVWHIDQLLRLKSLLEQEITRRLLRVRRGRPNPKGGV